MSRVGRKPVSVPNGVEITIGQNGQKVAIKGPKGTLNLDMTGGVYAKQDAEAKQVQVERKSELRVDRAKHGLYRALLANMIEGVTKGYERELEIQGVGYRAMLQGKTLKLWVGFNTKIPEIYDIPEGVTVEVPAQTQIKVSGIDKQLVGQVAASIRAIRPPDVYKGKGVRYKGEQVRRLAGKTVGAGK